MTFSELNKETKSSIINYALDYLSGNGVGIYGCDLHNEIYNKDYFIIYHSQAIEWMENCEIDSFRAIEIVQEYEKSNFGEVNTEIDPASIVNMLAYIFGELVLAESKTLQKKWDYLLTENDCKKIQKELEALL